MSSQTQTATPTVTTAGISPARFVRRLWEVNPPLTLVGLMVTALLAVTVAGLILDQRLITGAPAWLKPAKFAISVALYAFTFVWMLGFVERRRFLVVLAATATVTAVAFALEMVILVMQVVRGRGSHFNVQRDWIPRCSARWDSRSWFSGL